ncbi:MAG: arginine--tRNA ligase [Planctomycetes bacterium]|nr:arginine--tRNA ligase [Planctomycetota bacterium]
MRLFADQIARALAQASGLAESELKIELPRDPAHGDLAFPCFLVAKALRKPPPAVAAELAGKLAIEGIEVKALGPYLNFRIDRGVLARAVLAEIQAQGAQYGSAAIGAGKTVVIDFSSPNIAKPMHVGHIRSTILGATLRRLFAFLGYRVVGINHIGDWGAQFGGLVVAIRRWKNEVDLERDPVQGLLELYQRSKKASEEDPQFESEARAAYQELESGKDGEVRALWRWVTEVSLRGFDKTYARLGIEHDLVRGESFYEPFLEPTIRRAEQAGVTEVSQGALVVALGGIDKSLAETPCLLRQSNGTTLYATRDLAGLFHRWDEFHFERCLYVVGGEQKLHFRQLKAVLKRMQLDWEPRVEHIDFGLLLGPGRVKLASRKGEVLVLDDLIDEVVEEAARILGEKQAAMEPAERLPEARLAEVAEAVGIGALCFNDQKRERIKDVLFDKAEILSFEGDTGPYLQYTHARFTRILAKAASAGEGGGTPDYALLAEAGPILLHFARFPDVVRSSAERCEPSELAQYLLGLCRELNNWYREHRVLGQDAALSASRLALVRASKTVLSNGLRLLGLRAPEQM